MKRTLKKALSLIVIFSMVIAMLPAITLPASAEASGNWTDTNNFDTALSTATPANITITTAKQLAGLAVAVNVNSKTYSGFTVTLGADIDLSEHYWVPIGKNGTYFFAGSFNGAGYKITGMSVNETTNPYAGLFGIVSSTGTISNVDVTGEINASLASTGTISVGGIAGLVEKVSAITNCSASVTMTLNAGTITAGGLIGTLNSVSQANTVTNCTASGTITATSTNATSVSSDGGLFGKVTGTASYLVNVKNCSASVNLAETSSYQSNMGGFVGNVTYLTIINSYSTGSVTNTSNCNEKRIGGFAGYINTGSTINNSYATGSVTSTGTAVKNYAGGFMGYAAAGTVSNCYSTGTVNASGGSTTANFGGFVGNTAATLTNCYYPFDAYSGNTTVTGAYGVKTGSTTNLTGLTADQFKGVTDITNTYTTGTATYNTKRILYALNTAAGSIAGTKAWTQASDVNNGYPSYRVLWSDRGNYDAGIAGAAAANITITTAAQLAGLAVAVNGGKNYSGFTVTLGANIDLGAYAWMPIGTDATNYFAGSFNGAGYTISGMNVSTVSNEFVGLFGYVNSATATLSNIKIAGSISASYAISTTGYTYLYAGGLVGYIQSTAVKACSSSVNVSPTSANGVYAGGLAGYFTNSAYTGFIMSDCTASGTVTPTDTGTTYSYIGGLIGYAHGAAREYSVQNSTFTGSVTTTAKSPSSGGIFGYSTYVTYNNCWTSGAVNNNMGTAGGILKTGGFGGEIYSTNKITNSYSTSNVTVTGTVSQVYAGGFYGSLAGGGATSTYTTNCYSVGTVNISGATITTKKCGGFAGEIASGGSTNCYYLYNGYNPGGTAAAAWGYGNTSAPTLTSLVGLTTDQLKNAATITLSYQTGSSFYNGKSIVYALNDGSGAVTNAKTWTQTAGKNGDYPYYIVNWTDPGNYDTTIATAVAANRTITTAAELAGLAVAVNSGKNYAGFTITLGANIDLSAYNWTPIGLNASYHFAGSFNGAGYKITGLNEIYYGQYGGLFGYVKGTGTISNVDVAGIVYNVHSALNQTVYTGGLAGYVENTTVTNCTSSVAVTGSDNVGGLVGQYVSSSVASLVMSKCSSTGTVTSINGMNGLSIGGLVGNTNGAAGYLVTIKNCLATAAVSLPNAGGVVYVGGFVGNQASYTTVLNCGARGDVTVTNSSNSYIGGFVANLTVATAYIYNSYATGNVKMTGTANNYVGGFVGTGGPGTIANCYSVGGITLVNSTGTWTGGFAGNLNSLVNSNCYYLYNAYLGNTRGYGTLQAGSSYLTGLTGAQLMNIDNITGTYAGQRILFALNDAATSISGGDSWMCSDTVNGGYPYFGTSNWADAGNFDEELAAEAADNITINTAKELAGFMVAVNGGTDYAGKTVTLGADIDLSQFNWTPIGLNTTNYFKGSFNGAGHNITGISVSVSSSASGGSLYSGFFGYLKGTGTISSLNVSGAASGTATSTMSVYVGGIAGYVENMTLTGCSSSVNATSSGWYEYCGSLVGRYENTAVTAGITASDCTASGTAKTFTTQTSNQDKSVGGLFGYLKGTSTYPLNVKNCAAFGAISAGSTGVGYPYNYIGGFVGYSTTVSFLNCYATGAINDNVNQSNAKYCGGFVGLGGGTFSNCYSTGLITARSTGTVSAEMMGGFGGYFSGTATNCYTTGWASITDTTTPTTKEVGAFAGRLYAANINCCYYSGSGTGYGANTSSTMASFTGLTEDQLRSKTTITATYGTATTAYNAQYLVNALNAKKASITDARAWTNFNSSFPYFAGNWADVGNYDATLATAPAANITISTPSQLAGFMVAVNSGISYEGYTVTVSSNIDINAYIWTPIGTAANPFKGSFNGGGYSITGMNLQSSTQYNGLFGYVSGTGSLDNISIGGSMSLAEASTTFYAGGVAGYVEDTSISNCNSRVVITQTGFSAYVGGIVGHLKAATRSVSITGCNNAKYLSSTNTGTTSAATCYTGGIVGFAEGSSSNGVTIDSCNGYAGVTSKNKYYSYTGGIVGRANFTTVLNSYISSDVTENSSGTESDLGGIVGYASNSNISNCYVIEVGSTYITNSSGTASTARVGGVVGYSTNGTVSNCFYYNANSGYVSAATSAVGGAFIGGNGSGSTISNCYYLYNGCSKNTTGYGANTGTISSLVGLDINQLNSTSNIQTTTTYVTGTTSYGGKTLITALNTAANSITGARRWLTITGSCPTYSTTWSDPGCFDATIATGGASDLTIMTARQLAGFMVAVNSGVSFEGKTVTMGASVNLIANNWVPIGTSASTAFKGTFNGNGYTISGMSLVTDSQYAGLFGYVSGAGTMIKNVTLSGSVGAATSGATVAGGLAGYVENASVSNCAVAVTVTASGANSSAGGLVGKCKDGASITDSSATGAVSLTDTGTGESAVGGFVGSTDSSLVTIKNCYATGNVTDVSTSTAQSGGFIGSAMFANITNCYATGAVTDTSASSEKRVGGFAGITSSASKVNNCYATGNVSSTGAAQSCRAGGFAGYASGLELSNCYSVGTVTASGATTGQYGCFVGLNSVETTDCYYLYSATMAGRGSTDVAPTSLTGLTAAQLKNTNVITTTYTTGTTPYAGKKLAVALNIAATSIPAAKGWKISVAINNGYPSHTDYLVSYIKPGTTPVIIDAVGVTSGDYLSAPAVSDIPAGFTLEGWYTDSGLTTKFDFATTTVSANTTLYANLIPTPITFVDATLANGMYGTAYAGGPIVATDGSGTFTYALKSGSVLPTGLTLNANGTITGTPTQIVTAHTFTVTVTDTVTELTKDAVFTITISAIGTAATPTSNVTPGAVEKGVLVTLTTTTVGASIYYTTNGDAPTVDPAKLYSAPFAINASGTIKAIAVKAGYTDSGVAEFAYTLKTYTVTYNSNTATGIVPTHDPMANTDTMTVATGASLSKTGYTFLRWNTAANGSGDPYAAGTTFTMGTAPVTLYAQWTAIPVSLTANALANGKYGEAYSQAISSATGGGNDFSYAVTGGALPAGITLSTVGGISGTPTALGTFAFTITATDSYTTGTASADYSLTITTAGKVATPVPNKAAGGIEKGTAVTLTTATVGADIYYTTNGDTPTASSTQYTDPITVDAAMTITAIAIKTGYDDSDIATLPYTINTHKLIYNGNCNTSGSVNVDKTLVKDETTLVLNQGTAARTGYTFAGWTTAPDGSGTSYAVGATFTMLTQDVTLYAKWTTNDYAVSYDGNGNTGGDVPTDASSPHAYNSAVTVLGNTEGLVKTGYTFAGWNTAADGSGTDYAAGASFNMPAAVVTLFAQWTINTYTITYNGNGNTSGSIPASQNVVYDVTTSTSDNSVGSLAKTGYSLNGWNTAANGSGTHYDLGGSIKMPAYNVTLYAEWTSIKYTVTYFSNRPDAEGTGTVPDALSDRIYQQSITVSGNVNSLTWTGYNFNGWNTAANGSGTDYAPGATFNMPTGNVNLYAKWVATNYHLLYNGNGNTAGSAPANGEFAYTTEATVATHDAGFVRTGYTFAGWNTQADGNGTTYADGATFTMPSTDVILYAKWTAVKYNVTYDGNGNNAVGGGTAPIDAADYTYMGSVTVANNTGALAKTGYTFVGWNTAANGSGTGYAQGASFNMPADNVTLYAQWSVNSYTLAYSGNGATGGNVPAVAQPYNYNATVTVLGNEATTPLEKTGYNFNGWNTAANGSGSPYAKDATFGMLANNVTLYAQWTAKPVTLTANAFVNGVYGTAYSKDIDAAAGGGESFTYAVTSGALPDGLVLVGRTISGTPTKVATFNFTIKATDSVTGGFASANYTITIDVAGTVATPVAAPVAGAVEKGTTVSLTTATSGASIYYTLDGTTPTEGSLLFSSPITISAGITITAIAFKTGYTNSGTGTFTYTVKTYSVTYFGNGSTGGTAPTGPTLAKGETVTVSDKGSLVNTGYTFFGWNTMADGKGIPYAAGAQFAMPAGAVSLYAIWQAIPVTLTANVLTDGTFGEDYGTPTIDSAAGGGGSFTYAMTGGALPDGLSFNADRTITGTPTKAGNFSFTITATDSVTGGTASANYTIKILAAGIVTSPVADPAPGGVEKGATVALTTTTTGAKIYYTTNGDAPTVDPAKLYSVPIAINAAVTIKAFAVKDGYTDSEVKTYSYTINMHDFKYDANGGSVGGVLPATVALTKDGTATVANPADLSIALTRTGYTFAGWYTTANGSGGTAYAAGDTFTMGTANVTLYAQWTAIPITFADATLANGTYGTAYTGGPIAATAGSETFSYAPKLGSSLPTGLTLNANGTITGTPMQVVAAHTFTVTVTDTVTTLTKDAVFTITILAAGTVDAPTSNVTAGAVEKGTLVTLTTTTTGATIYYTTNGDAPTVDPAKLYSVPIAINAACTLKAIAVKVGNTDSTVAEFAYTIKTHTVTYDANGTDVSGSVPTHGPMANTDTMTVATGASLAKTGYTFAGWNTVANGVGGMAYAANSTFTMGTADVILYAQWTQGSYTVTYNKNGASVSGSVPTDVSSPYVYDATVTVLGNTGNLARTGYTFGGWTLASNGSGTVYAAGNTFNMPEGNATLYAKWIPNSFTVSYNGNGADSGEAPAAISTYEVDATVNVLGNVNAIPFAKTGYRFVGWNTARDGSGTAYSQGSTFVMTNDAIVLYAVWAVENCFISYEGNLNTSGSAPALAYCIKGADVTVSAAGTLARMGYTFGGWNTKADGSGTAYDAGDTINMGSNVMLYAVWTPNSSTYKVTYDANGATGTAPADVDGGNVQKAYALGATVTVLDNTATTPLAKSGSDFAGWNTKADGTGTGYNAGATFIMPEGDVTLYAVWKAKISYKVSYDANGATGGSSPATSSYANGETVTVSANTGSLVKLGYTFKGWNTKADGTGTKTYTGTGAETFTVTAANVTLYAIWEKNKDLTVTYDANGATGSVPTDVDGSGDANLYEYGDVVTVLGNSATTPLAKAGFVFAGWNTKADGTGTAYIAGSKLLMPDVTPGTELKLYAVWLETGKYWVSYDGNGATSGKTPDTTVYADGAEVTVTVTTGVDELKKIGYTFKGWSLEPMDDATFDLLNVEYTGVGTEKFNIAAVSVTLYAVWEKNSAYTVSYNGNGSNGGTVPTDATTYSYGGGVTVSSDVPTKTGYLFMGWNTALNGSGTVYSGGEAFVMSSSNVTLYAMWFADCYIVSYDGNGRTGGNVPAGVSYADGTEVTIAGVGSLVRAGYKFEGWRKTPTGAVEYVAGDKITVATANITLYAVWSQVTNFKVTYDGNGSDGGTVPSDAADYSMGDAVTVKAGVPTKTGSDFLGWNTKDDGSGSQYVPGQGFNMPGRDVTLYAVWSVDRFSVTYDGNGATGGSAPLDNMAYKVGENMTTLGAGTLVNTSFTLQGWNTEADGSGTAYAVGSTHAVRAQSITLYAQWTTTNCTLTFSTDGGSTVTDITRLYGATIANSEITAPTKDGFTFAGWFLDVGLNTAVTFPYTFTGNVTFYAKWQANALYTDGTVTAPFNLDLTSSEGQVATVTATHTISTTPSGLKEDSVSLLDQSSIDALKKFAEEHPKFTVKLNMGEVDNFNATLTAQTIEDLGANEITVDIGNGATSYIFPAAAIDIDGIMSQFGAGADPAKVHIKVEVTKATEAERQNLSRIASINGYEVTMEPINFAISAAYGDRTYEVTRLRRYTSRLIRIPEGTPLEKVTTAIVVEEDGATRHIPTKVTTVDGVMYAQINSLSNSTYAIIHNTSDYSDVSGHWAENEIDSMGARTAVNGVGGNMFEPERNITRAEFAALVVKGMGIKLSEKTGAFKDVSADSWCAYYVQTAFEMGIVKGYEDGSFQPQGIITREQAFAMIYRAMSITGLGAGVTEDKISGIFSQYKDSSTVAEYFKTEVAAMISTQIVNGRDSTHIAPKANITRAEATIIIHRLLKNSNLI